MKILSNLSAVATESAAPIESNAFGVDNVQSQQGFWRKLNCSKDIITMKSSSGGLVQIPIEELWKLGESLDASLKVPVATPPLTS